MFLYPAYINISLCYSSQNNRKAFKNVSSATEVIICNITVCSFFIKTYLLFNHLTLLLHPTSDPRRTVASNSNEYVHLVLVSLLRPCQIGFLLSVRVRIGLRVLNPIKKTNLLMIFS